MLTIEKTIILEYQDGYFKAQEGVSETFLREALDLGGFPEHRADANLPTLVAKGYRVGIVGDYQPRKDNWQPPYSPKIGGVAHSVKNPCISCQLKDVCSPDECGRKLYRLFTNN